MRLLLFAIFTFFSVQSNAQNSISLLMPFDFDTLDNKNPNFNWSYLGFGGQENRSDYRFVLVELEDDQSAQAGLQVNTPIFVVNDLTGSQLFYPYDAPELEEGKRYGWEIQKHKNGILDDKSESWEFYIPIPEIPIPSYYKMKIKNDGIYYIAKEGKLYFQFEEQYVGNRMKISIYDVDNEKVDTPIILDPQSEVSQNQIILNRTGKNLFMVDLGTSLSSGKYTLKIKDARNQIYKMKFKVN